jgi:uncharacterized Tic20 family protein
MTGTARNLIGLVLAALAAAGAFAAWLGRDTAKTLDPATGQETGPWSTGQVVACVVTLLVILVVAVVLKVQPLIAAAGLTVGFTLAWAVTAARGADDGLWAVGAALVFIGTAVGSSVVALITARIARR